MITGGLTSSICVLPWRLRDRRTVDKLDPLETFAVYFSLSVSILAILVFLIHPGVFAILSYENGVAETASVVFLLFCCCLFAVIALRSSRAVVRIGRLTIACFWQMSLLSFLIMMEETS